MQELSPEQITARFHQMGVLLLLDSPPDLQFGIDNITWQTGSKFKGIKLIPLGTHIINYSLKNQNYMFPIKKFIYFGPSHKQVRDEERIRVFKWSTKLQRFTMLKGEEADGYREGVKKLHFDCYLGPYPQQNIQFWANNTKFITKQVLDKLDPVEYYEDYEEQYESKNKSNQEQKIGIDEQSQGQNQLNEYQNQPRQKQINEQENQDSSEVEGTKNKKQSLCQIKKGKDFGGNIFYSDIPRRLSESLSHTTQINIDRTQILQTILKVEWPKNSMGILGQLQYSFVAFLIGQCLDSYNQWKKLTIMLSSAENAFNTHKNLMLEFIVVFYEQVRQFPQNFFFDELAKDNFLTICLKRFKTYLTQRTLSKKALSRIEKCLVLVKQKFSYDPQDQQQEQSPIIVEQNESYF